MFTNLLHPYASRAPSPVKSGPGLGTQVSARGSRSSVCSSRAFISRLHSFEIYNSIVSIQKMYKNLLRDACNSCANPGQADLARELHTTALIVLRAHLIYQSPCPPSELTSRLFKETAHSNHMAFLEPVDRGPAPRTRGSGDSGRQFIGA